MKNNVVKCLSAIYCTLLLAFSTIYGVDHSKNKIPQASIKQLSFMEGKWKATASDSSFTSILQYTYSPNQRLLMGSNHLYGKEDNLIRIYEGGYMVKGDKFIYILSGPDGEVHEGTAMLEGFALTHLAAIFLGKNIKSYKSEVRLKGEKLYYYANYSRKVQPPKDIDYSDPLIYSKVDIVDK